MATPQQIQQLRRLADYHETDPYDDTQLSTIVDETSLYRAAERLWNERAASLVGLVNVSESGSSRSLGDMHKNALAMAAHFRKLAETDEAPVDTTRFATTRPAVRE